MFRVFLLLSLLEICLATPHKIEVGMQMEPMSDEEIFYINSIQSSWTAGRNFIQEDFENVKRRLGVDIEANKRYNELHPIPESDVKIRDDLPEEFDCRKKWSQCKSINEIRDQSSCGSGWVFGAVEAMTDRMCIHTKTPVNISAEDILTCCRGCGFGCGGGFVQNSWDYFRQMGVVSGGNYNSNEGCMPYSFPKCDHYVSGKYKPCNQNYTAPNCTAKCREGYGKTYQEDKHYGGGLKSFISEQQIMQEIVDNGPISANFMVFSDFFSYKSGIYKHTTGKPVGGHTIKIIGYGVDKGQKYWIVANSWNEDWGDKGFFKIAKARMMSTSVFLLSLLGICMATPLEFDPLSDAQIFYINNVQLSWKAGRNFHPDHLERVKGLAGTDLKTSERYIQQHRIPESDAKVRGDLPEEFDARTKWPQCKSIGEIRDQSSCGNDWAFGPIEAMTDRWCIHANTTVHLSTEDVTDCCGKDCGSGCKGGYLPAAWDYMAKKGVVSGGNYNSNEGCMPYSLPECDHHINPYTNTYKNCSKWPVSTPACTAACRKGYSKTYDQDKRFGQKVKYFKTEEQIMQEIVDNGPVSAALYVYEDFFNYKSGVYKHTTGRVITGHAVKLIGYGVEKGTKYWTAVNCWNKGWGDQGFFKIVRGKNECRIEDFVMAALPRQ